LSARTSRERPTLSAPITFPSVPITPYRDGFGNWCSRIVAPAGRIRLFANGTVRDSGSPDTIVPSAAQHAVEDLPSDTIVYLLGSRYCETDRLSETAWKLFGKSAPGWTRVQAICEFVHNHISFGYEHARATMTAWDAFNEGKGVCRDYAHLAIAFCRCMNIPARYCTGYLGDIGMPPPYAAGDFAGWFEAYRGGPLVHIRCTQQHSADQPYPDRPGARCCRRSHHPDLRAQYSRQFQGMD
jgi:transglutaminase-like putative cysteine protease